jgi:homoserine dehydrogenase
MNEIKIGLLGCGHVGSGVWKVLLDNREQIREKTGNTVAVSRILVRSLSKVRPFEIPGELFTTRIEDILTDAGISVVVELVGGIEPAREWVERAIRVGKHVVTANKALMASCGPELFALAHEHGVQLRFEGSVGGGIPVIAAMTESLAANRFEQVTGIINGTTNYILTKMTEEGLSFGAALKRAQEKGYAEADPTSDIDGEDAAFKLAILASIAFEMRILPQTVPCEGIRRISITEIEYARRLGYVIKLLATAKRTREGLVLHVHPALVPLSHPLASVSNEYNALFIRGDAVGELMLYGKGAGSLPTASAVVGDILYIVQARGMQGAGQARTQEIPIVGEGAGEYYIRLQVEDKPGVLGTIATIFGKYGVSIASVVQQGQGESVVPLVFVTHMVEKSVLDQALADIGKSDEVREIASILRVETL